MSAIVMTEIDEAVDDLVPLVGAKGACEAVALPRDSYYRARAVAGQAASEPSERGESSTPSPTPSSAPSSATPSPGRERRPQQQPRALSDTERATVLEVLHSERFVDSAPSTVYATLLDEGVYLCSEATMYRLLRERGETGDRRRQATHPAKVKPELSDRQRR